MEKIIQRYLLHFSCHYLNCFITVKFVQFLGFVKLPLLKCLRLIETKKITCGNCGTQRTKVILARHKKRRSVGTLYYTLSTKSQADLKYQFAEKNSVPKPAVTSNLNFVIKNFQDFTLYVTMKTANTAFL